MSETADQQFHTVQSQMHHRNAGWVMGHIMHQSFRTITQTHLKNLIFITVLGTIFQKNALLPNTCLFPGHNAALLWCSGMLQKISLLLFSSNIHLESFSLQWFRNDSCVPPASSANSINGNIANGWGNHGLHFNSIENKHRILHLSVFVGLLSVGILELLFGASQIVIGFLGCLCGVSKRRSQIV